MTDQCEPGRNHGTVKCAPLDLRHCRGCRDDFYNDKNPLGVQRCWLLHDAKLVTRYRIGTWTEPGKPGAFTEVTVPNCYHADWQHFYEQLPSFVRAEDVIRGRR